MTSVTVKAGATEPIHVYARAAAGGALTGSSNLRVQIRRAVDGFFLDFADATFKSSGWTTRQGTLTETDATNDAGWYRYSTGVDTTGWSAGLYLVTAVEITTTLVSGGPQFATGEIRIGGSIESLDSRIPATLVSGRIDASAGAVAADAITATAIAADAITSAKIADGALTAAKLADNAITAAKIATDAIGAAQIAADAIGASELAAGAVAEIQSGLATSAALADVATSAADAATRAVDLQARVPAALVSGRMDASVGAMAANTLTASALAADAVTEIQTGLGGDLSALTAAVAAIGVDVDDVQARLPAALVGGRMDASVGAVASGAITAAAIAADAIGSSQLAASAATEIRTGLATSTEVAAVGTVLVAVGSAVDALALDVDDVQARLPATLIAGRMDSHVGAMSNDTLTSGALASSAVTEIQTGLASAASLATLDGKVVDVQARIPAALVSGRIDASVGAMAANTLTAAALAADAVTEITAGVGAAVWATAVSAPASGTYGRYIQRVFQLGFNRLELASTGGGQNTLYDDDASTPLVVFTIRDVAGSSIASALTSGAPARRGAGAAP